MGRYYKEHKNEIFKKYSNDELKKKKNYMIIEQAERKQIKERKKYENFKNVCM